MAFECIPSNLEAFGRNVDLNLHLKERVRLVANPVWDLSGRKLPYIDWGPGSRVIDDIDRLCDGTAETATIDESLDRLGLARVDFIKMDVEGAELAALRGAEASIRKHRPKLAISVYHSLEDMETIPRYLAGLDLGYRFCLDHHTIYGNETVLFGVPSQKIPSLHPIGQRAMPRLAVEIGLRHPQPKRTATEKRRQEKGKKQRLSAWWATGIEPVTLPRQGSALPSRETAHVTHHLTSLPLGGERNMKFHSPPAAPHLRDCRHGNQIKTSLHHRPRRQASGHRQAQGGPRRHPDQGRHHRRDRPARPRRPAGAAVVDARNRLMHPGLINAHTHGPGNLGKGLGDLLVARAAADGQPMDRRRPHARRTSTSRP